MPCWKPPGNPIIESYTRLLRKELELWDASCRSSNLTWLDRKALAWLKQHAASVSVVDCDKGLGDALVLRSWVYEQVLYQLPQGYVQIEPDEFKAKQLQNKQFADCLVLWFRSTGAVSPVECRFLLSALGAQSDEGFSDFSQSSQDPSSFKTSLQFAQCLVRSCFSFSV